MKRFKGNLATLILMGAACLCTQLPAQAVEENAGDTSEGVSVANGASASGKQAARGKQAAYRFQDNTLMWWYGSWFRSPYANNGGDVQMNGVQFSHLDHGNRFGDNFFDITYIFSNSADPVSKAYFHGNSTGARDGYITYRHDIGLDHLLKTKRFKFGWVNDVMLTAGIDLDAKNNDYGGERCSPMIGPSVLFRLPVGHHASFKLSTMWTKEWNEEGTDVTSYYTDSTGAYIMNSYHQPIMKTYGKAVAYDATYMVSATWNIPFNVGKAPFAIEGFGVFSGGKGYTGGSLAYNSSTGKTYMSYQGTKPETILRPKVMYNFGSLFGKEHNWQIGAGYHYWNNKFGTDHHYTVGCLQHAPFITLAIHL